MKKTLLLACLSAAFSAYAQPFTPNTGSCGLAYGRVCMGTATGFSYSDVNSWDPYYLGTAIPETRDVHGGLTNTSNYHYTIGEFTNGSQRDIFYFKKNRLDGDIVDFLAIDANVDINNGTQENDIPRRMTIDETNHLMYVVGEFVTSGTSTPFLLCYDISGPASKMWAVALPGGDHGLDVTLDNNLDIYVLSQPATGGTFDIYKYDNTGSILGSFNNSSFSGSTSPYPYRLAHDNTTDDIYVVGTDGGNAFIGGINTSLSAIDYRTTSSAGGYYDADIDVSNGELVAVGTIPVGFGMASGTWASWDVSTTPYTLSYNGVGTSTDEAIIDVQVTPAGQYIVIAIDATSGSPERYLTYVDKAANGGLGDVHYGTNSYHFVNNPSGILATCMHRDSDGYIVVGGFDGGNVLAWTAKFNNPGVMSWSGYQNKSTSTQSIQKEKVTTSPNPVKAELTVSGNSAKQYRISNTLGQIILQGEINNNKINVSQLSSGNYFIQVISNTHQQIAISKFVKE
ncbi:MAG TPA: T9SS type A sorting domain-containing protein [Flavipsychrobacter sp.]|nr:T9SS type A sorting domain-containing protein [Flavipsychrobacter sp.]